MKNISPLLSIIVPVYGTERLLPRCIESVLNCSYKNIELIIVNDKSPGNASEIIKSYQQVDDRIKYVCHEKNKGLYLARLTGSEYSQGDYIAFLDSDDHVSVDLYRRLIEKAEKTDSDMVMGEVLLEKKDIYSYFNFSHTRILDVDVKGEDCAKLLFEQEGRDFTLHVVWNKVYRRDLWDRCYPYLKLQKKHLIMCEDVLYSSVLYSSVLYSLAKHITNIHGDFVYYYQDINSSTGNNLSLSKVIKNISDIELVFITLEEILKNQCFNFKYFESLNNWKLLLFKIWRRNIQNSNLFFWEKRQLYKKLCINGKKVEESLSKNEEFFYSALTDKQEILSEQLKRKIIDTNISIVSFDIFDTLIVRPFWFPTDLFSLLNHFVSDELQLIDCLDFRNIRIQAEKNARENVKIAKPMWEEITLDDIYDEVKKIMDISSEQVQKIKNKEIELELKYCLTRKYTKELYDLAKFYGKKIIITSDMYLPENIIKRLLAKNGYDVYEKLYLSSSLKITKASGNLYSYIVKDLKTDSKNILHVGDNLISDVKNSRKLGLQSFYLPKTTEVFSNQIKNIYGGESVSNIYLHAYQGRDAQQLYRFWGLRTMLAVVANKIFDNPYSLINNESDFNADPNYIGYYALGMHLFALAHWLLEENKKYSYDNFNFMARDGFLPLEAFKILNQTYGLTTNTNYLHLTRSSILPLQVLNGMDLLNLERNINVFSQTPRKIIEMIKIIIRADRYENCKIICEENGYIYDSQFSSLKNFYQFISLIRTELMDKEKIKKYKEHLEVPLLQFFYGKTATFDVGYSCRVESTLKRNYKFDITPYYLHINNDLALERAKRNGIEIKRFYEYSPGVTGTLRELFISKLEPSCKSLKFENEKLLPIFKDYHLAYEEKYIINNIQKSALMFVSDIQNIFGKDIFYFTYQKEDASLPFEYYQTRAKYFDRLLFAAVPFEDAFGLGGEVNLLDFWNGQIANVNEFNSMNIDPSLKWMKPLWKRVICLYFIDRNTLKRKVEHRLENNQRKLKILKIFYGFFRSIYRKVK